MKHFILFTCVFGLFSVLTKAQDYYRIFELEYEYGNSNKYDDDDASISMQEHEANLSIPIKRENGDAYVFGLGYSNLSLFDFKESTSISVAPDTFYTIEASHSYTRYRLQAGYSKKLNDRTSLVILGFGRLASDMVQIESDHYLFGGLFMFTRKKNEKFTWKYGLYANQEHFGYLIIPLIGCDWKVSDKWRIFGVLPRRLSITYTTGERFRTGLVFEAPNRSYKVSQNGVYTSDGQVLDTYVQNTKNVLYALGEVYIVKGLVLRGRVGYTVGRDIELYESSDVVSYMTWGVDYGLKRTQISEVPRYRDFQDNLVLNVSIDYRFSLD